MEKRKGSTYPFQRIVFASATASRYNSLLFGPTSSPNHPLGIPLSSVAAPVCQICQGDVVDRENELDTLGLGLFY